MPESTEPPQSEPTTPIDRNLAPIPGEPVQSVSAKTDGDPEAEVGPGAGRVIRETVETIIRESFAGPLPPPDFLKLYDEVAPGLAKELVRSVFSEGEHRRQLQTKKAEAQVEAMRRTFAEARMGQFCALIFGLAAMFFGSYTATHGAQWAGGFIGVGGIGSIVTTFILGREKQKQDRLPGSPSQVSRAPNEPADEDRED